MTLSNAAEIVFLSATVLVLLRVNHDRNGRTDGRPDSDDGNRGKATFGCVSPKKYRAREIPDDTSRLVAESCL